MKCEHMCFNILKLVLKWTIWLYLNTTQLIPGSEQVEHANIERQFLNTLIS